MEDSQILELLYERSERAIAALSEKYGSVCRRVANNILNDVRDVEECVNDAYLGAWNTIPPQKPQPLRSYVCRIVRNFAIKRYHANTAAKRNSCYDVALDELENCFPAAIRSFRGRKRRRRWTVFPCVRGILPAAGGWYITPPLHWAKPPYISRTPVKRRCVRPSETRPPPPFRRWSGSKSWIWTGSHRKRRPPKKKPILPPRRTPDSCGAALRPGAFAPSSGSPFIGAGDCKRAHSML